MLFIVSVPKSSIINKSTVNKLSIILLHISNGNLLWQIIVSVVSEDVALQLLQIYF